MQEPILSIATVVDRATIRIADELYELQNTRDLTPYEHQTLLDRAAVADPLVMKPRLKPAEEKLLTKALSDMVKLLLPSITVKVAAKLTNTERYAIFQNWATYQARIAADAADGGNPGNRQSRRAANRRTGSSSSPASRRSTGATRRGGSTRRTGS